MLLIVATLLASQVDETRQYNVTPPSHPSHERLHTPPPNRFRPKVKSWQITK